MKKNLYIFIFLCIFNPLISSSKSLQPGSEVVNQASIRFEDEMGTSQTITTNVVVLTIRQVFSATLDGDRSFEGIAGQSRAFLHTLQNTGNGPDTYCISIKNMRGDSGDFSAIRVIHDININGRVDMSDPTIVSTAISYSTNLYLVSDETAHLIVLADIPASSSQNSTYSLLLTVQAKKASNSCQNNSVTDIGQNADNADDTNIDQVVVTDHAILLVTKESVYQSNGDGIADDTIVYQISVQNKGNRIARDIILTDILPQYTIFQENSIQSASDFVVTPGIDDGVNGLDGQSPYYDSQLGQIRGEIDVLPVDSEINFTYVLAIDSTAPGDTLIENSVSMLGDLDENENTDESAVISNKTFETIPITYGVQIIDTGMNAAMNVNDGGDDDGSLNDQQYVDQVSQGAIVWFTHQVTNMGNADDTFALIISNSTFPEFTGFQFFHANQSSPLLDTNSDGYIDFGSLSSGATRTIVIGAVLPKNVRMDGPFIATITARSSGNDAFEDSAQIRLGKINALCVDIANTEMSTGMHDIIDADPVSQITTIANYIENKAVTFDLYVANEGDLIDQYQLSAWKDSSASIKLPDTWNIRFFNPAGEIISSTPLIFPGQTFHCQLRIEIPKNQTPEQIPIFIKVYSSVTLVWDIKQDAINIPQTETLRITPNNQSTVTQGGAVEYIHNVQNTGNTLLNVQVSVSYQSLMSHSLMLPQLFDGTRVTSFKTLQNFSAGEKVVVFDSSENKWMQINLVDDGNGGTAVPLAPNDNLQFKVRVIAPTQLSANSIDILTVAASVPGKTISVSCTDKTTAAASQLQITKMGARDILCSADMETMNTFVSSHFQANPGECIVWQILAVNSGAEPVCEVKLYDKAPAFTFIQGAPIIYAQPYPGGTGVCSVNNEELECCVGNSMDINGDGTLDHYCLKSGERAEIRFRVEIE